MVVRATFGLLISILFVSTPLQAASITVQWEASSSPETAGYIFNVFSGDSPPLSYDVGKATAARLDNLVTGNTYYVYTTAYATNRVQSGPSNLLIYTVPQDRAGAFIQPDTVTGGSWKGVYGNEGYWMAGAPAALPAYTTVTTPALQWIWSSQTTSPLALAVPESTNRMFACWYSATQIGYDFRFTDGNFHRVSLYFIDATSSGRQQRVEVVNRDTGAIVDSTILTGFSKGIYLTWDLTGNVSIRVTAITVNAVVSGVFFDKVPTSARFVNTDIRTLGDWKLLYGSRGFLMAAVPSSVPAFARATTSTPQWTWIAHSTNSLGLMYPNTIIYHNPGTPTDPIPYTIDRILACWYSSTLAAFDFSITANQNHRVTVYFLDGSRSGRQQYVDLVDRDTGRLLDSQMLTNFSNGIYLTWEISGNVSILLTPFNVNAVASGIFFD
jgi:hypothetical protein